MLRDADISYFLHLRSMPVGIILELIMLNPSAPELNPSAQRCLTIFYWGFCFLNCAFR
jgi:hypothetical protein